MKKLLAWTLLIALVACMWTAALAEGTVRVTKGSVNLRTGPGLKYAKVGTVHKGDKLTYLGQTRTDSRGVKWYKVSRNGKARWISSRMSKLSGASSSSKAAVTPAPIPEATPTPLPLVEATATPLPAAPVQLLPDSTEASDAVDVQVVELSDYYLSNLDATAQTLGLTTKGEDNLSELKNFYKNDGLLIAGNDLLEHFLLTAPGYSLFGVYVGMDIETARGLLTGAGLTEYDNAIGAYFQHPASDKSLTSVGGFDSGINIMTDGDGKVTEISWNTYTG